MSIESPAPTQERSPDAPNTPRSLWRNRDYLLLWSGQAFSDIGGSVSELAYPLLVLAITHAAAQAGFVAALRAAPAVVLSLLAGVLVDRWNRRWVMLVCDIGRALCLASIPIAYALGHLTIWQLYVTALVEGSLMVVFNLARSAAVSQVVEREQLTAAVAREELVEGTTALCGPPLSGALSYAISIVTLSLIRTPFQRERSTGRRRVWAEMSEGVRWVARQPFILSMTLLMGAGTLVLSSEFLVVIILAQRQHAGAFVIGLIIAVSGVGAILGSLLAPRLKSRLSVGHSVMVARWYFALSWPLYALVPVAPMLGALQFGTGVIDPIEDVPYFSHRLELIPDELKGRVLSACRMFPGTLRPLGLALTGILIQRFGIFPTIWLQWAWLFVTTGIVTIIPYVRRERSFS